MDDKIIRLNTKIKNKKNQGKVLKNFQNVIKNPRKATLEILLTCKKVCRREGDI